jgi:hypothetical protein
MNPFYDPPPGAITFSVDAPGESFYIEVEKIIHYTNLGMPVPMRRANMPEAFLPDVHPEVIQGMATNICYYVGSIADKTHAVAFHVLWNEPAPGLTRALLMPGEGELCAPLVAQLMTHLQKTYRTRLRLDNAPQPTTHRVKAHADARQRLRERQSKEENRNQWEGEYLDEKRLVDFDTMASGPDELYRKNVWDPFNRERRGKRK